MFTSPAPNTRRLTDKEVNSVASLRIALSLKFYTLACTLQDTHSSTRTSKYSSRIRPLSPPTKLLTFLNYLPVSEEEASGTFALLSLVPVLLAQQPQTLGHSCLLCSFNTCQAAGEAQHTRSRQRHYKWQHLAVSGHSVLCDRALFVLDLLPFPISSRLS